MKKIKWENIIMTVLMVVYVIPMALDRIATSGLFNGYVITEIVMALAIVGTFALVVKDIRTNPSNWN